MADVTLPGPSPYGCRINHAAVREAVADFGLADPVVIEWLGLDRPPGDPHADHEVKQADDGRTFHLIRLSVWDSPERVSWSLWHELAHARQTEAIGARAYKLAYEFGQEVAGYDDNIFEREARQVAADHADVLLTDPEGFDPTVPDAAWRSAEELRREGAFDTSV